LNLADAICSHPRFADEENEMANEHQAIVASLIATAKLNNIEPFAYLRVVLERLSDGYPMGRLDDLLPWNWTQLRAAA
jgi:hypothetical protein